LDEGKIVIEGWTLATIVSMAFVTYFTRIGGYLLLGNRELSQRTTMVLDAAPGCVLIAVVAPTFVSGRAADLIALVITCAAATRLPLLATVLIAIGSAGLLRYVLG
jgi:uncharacterized membrane protein